MRSASARSATGTSPRTASQGIPPRPANFDRLARPYRWLEALAFGRALERCRTRLLPHVLDCRRALVLGDGDGRALHELLRRNNNVEVIAVDSSRAMLRELRRRCGGYQSRLVTRHRDALASVVTLPADDRFDLVVTHFFLDCLDQLRLDALAAAVTAHSTPATVWLISEFRAPQGWRGAPARAVVRLLYVSFGLLTGLAVRRLPDHAAALSGAGWICMQREASLFGLLTAELWKRSDFAPVAEL